MVLIAHIAIALISVIYTAYVFFAPSQSKLKATYVLVALTIASGTWLIISNPAHMVQSCITGLAYLGVMFFGIAMARNKLAVSEQDTRDDR
jgi:hypothetical protein